MTGHVSNDGDGVWCEVQGTSQALAELAERVELEAPPLARIESIDISELSALDESSFVIQATSHHANGASGETEPSGTMLIPPDIAPCPECLAELADVGDRRHNYAFLCCTNCGPRFTVVQDLPYDRSATSMAGFELCGACAREFEEPTDRRFHAQATCCRSCGPSLRLSTRLNEDPIDGAIALLRRGGVLAVKGRGGYQLICRADKESPVATLRSLKHRDEKPFAVLVQSVGAANAIALVDVATAAALLSPEAPIVLAPAREGTSIARGVAPDTGLLGVMLPASPLHHLLATGVGTPLVCTSGNVSAAPIVIDDDEANRELSHLSDAVLSHDLVIERRADDSVGQVVNGRFQLLRRARGFAPRPIQMASIGPTVLGVGAELKSTVCLANGQHAGVSVHLGDLENPATLSAFEQTIADQLSLSRATPELVVHDLHPEYLSTKFALTQDLAPTLGVQHHHAHLVSCLVDNRSAGPAIGVTFDGMGWGTDDTAWGGEFLVGDASGFERVAHLAPVAMPGGAAAIREPWRMAVAFLVGAYGNELPDVPVLERQHELAAPVAELCKNPITMATSSMGRLFDAVSSLCGVCDVGSYEGQAAIGLEQLAERAAAPYDWDLLGPSIDTAPLIAAIVEDLARGATPAHVAGRFHSSVSAMVVSTCLRLAADRDLGTVALTGGVFQNRLLTELVGPALAAAGLDVLQHAQVPPNDGGISLGQVEIGRAHLHLSR